MLNHLENPDVMFIMETRLKCDEVQAIKIKIGFDSCLSLNNRSNTRGRDGGFILF